MAVKFTLFHPRTLPLFTSYYPLSLTVKFKHIFKPLLCSSTTASLSFSSLPYGPSLLKGHSPSPLQLPRNQSSNDAFTSFDEGAFTRVYDISALRVPSDLCSPLENRLRGHLLNWPRIKNIARVAGDEIDEELKSILPSSSAESEVEELVALSRRIHGKAEGDGEPLNALLYRDKLAKTFNSRGYVNFRNLAKISRPKKKKKKRDDGGKRVGQRDWKNGMALVEVVEAGNEVSDDEDLSGLLGVGFNQSQWRGSTRLILLDERYTDGSIDELPKAIKVVLEEHEGTSSAFEIVKCRLTLFYDYWQLNEVLEALLPRGTIIPSAFETVGHIAHLNLKEEHLPYKNLIAKVVLDKNKPKIQTVVNKIDAIQNDYRTMQLEVLAGNNSLVTTVVENGLRFHVDLATVYWNSRLATERQRLLDCFTQNDVVFDVFAGVGPIAISAAKKVKYVYANDLNPRAVEYLERNTVLNKLERKIEVFNMDGRRFIETVFTNRRSQAITQVVMNLPNNAIEFLNAFRGIFKVNSPHEEVPMPKIHVYGFSKAQDLEFDFEERIRIVLPELGSDIEVRRVRLVAPGKWMLCASFILPEKMAYSKTGANL